MKKLIITLLVVMAWATTSGQSVNDIRINEILVKNSDNYEDDYGHRSSWVELYNTGHSKVNIGGCYLRIVKEDGDTTIYRIPTGDPRTEIGPLGYSVFFCEGTGTKGTFYTNFTLERVTSVALLNASGKGKPVDEVSINYDRQFEDVSIGYMTRDDGEVIFTTLPQTTPNATNDTEPLIPRHEKFRLLDPYGVMMMFIAIIVVMSVLIVLTLSFKYIGKYMVSRTRKRTIAAETNVLDDSKAKPYDGHFSGDEIAAIAMAIMMYREDLHDKESKILTINKVARTYSPWSSKIYGLGQFSGKK